MYRDELIDHIRQLRLTIPPGPSSRFISAAYLRLIKKVSVLPPGPVKISIIQRLDITQHMKSKLAELLKLKPIKKDPIEELRKCLEDIPGIGPKKIEELISNGVKELDDLRKPKYINGLSESASLFVKLRPERQIPHSLISRIKNKLDTSTETVRWETYFVGSYRRRRPTSRDIDVMLVSDDPADLSRYVEFVRSRLPRLYQYAVGKDKVSFVVGFGRKYYKFDIFRTPTKSKWAMLLYSTGSKEFNVWMRGLAKRNGFLLNQEGLFRGKEPVPVSSEAGYFEALSIPYIDPEKREK